MEDYITWWFLPGLALGIINWVLVVYTDNEFPTVVTPGGIFVLLFFAAALGPIFQLIVLTIIVLCYLHEHHKEFFVKIFSKQLFHIRRK